MNYRFPRLATNDLNDIWDYVAADSVHAADKSIDRFTPLFELLAQYPKLGVRDHQFKTRRLFVLEKYVIRPESDGVTIIRVRHGSQLP